MQLSLVSRSKRFAAALGLALGGLFGSAQAAVFVTDWDPLFNPLFAEAPGANLGWFGTGFVTVDDACLVPSTVQPVPGVPCTSASFDGYSLTFYDTVPANVISGGFGAGLFPAVTQVSVDGSGNVDGIEMAADFSIGAFVFGASTYDVELDFTSLSVITLRLTGTAGPDIGTIYTNAVAPLVTWTRVSEPATLLLAALAAGLAGWARRRR